MDIQERKFYQIKAIHSFLSEIQQIVEKLESKGEFELANVVLETSLDIISKNKP